MEEKKREGEKKVANLVYKMMNNITLYCYMPIKINNRLKYHVSLTLYNPIIIAFF